jgi:hypothetical protein
VFRLANYLSYETQKPRAIPSFALMPRDPKAPSLLAAAGFDLMFLANADREHPEVVPYSAHRDAAAARACFAGARAGDRSGRTRQGTRDRR